MAKGALHVLLVIKVETQCSRNVLVNKWFSIKVSVGETLLIPHNPANTL